MGCSARSLRLSRQGRRAKAFSQVVAESPQFVHVQRHEHDGKRFERELAEQPGKHTRIQPSVLSQGEGEVTFRWVSGAIEEKKIHQISGLRSGEQAGELVRVTKSQTSRVFASRKRAPIQ
jgi:hypothetical protein